MHMYNDDNLPGSGEEASRAFRLLRVQTYIHTWSRRWLPALLKLRGREAPKKNIIPDDFPQSNVDIRVELITEWILRGLETFRRTERTVTHAVR